MVRNSSSNCSLRSMSAEAPATLQRFTRSASSTESMTQNRTPDRLNSPTKAKPDLTSRDRTSTSTRFGRHSIPSLISGSLGSTILVAKPYVWRALARAPASRSLPATKIRAGIPRRFGPALGHVVHFRYPPDGTRVRGVFPRAPLATGDRIGTTVRRERRRPADSCI